MIISVFLLHTYIFSWSLDALLQRTFIKGSLNRDLGAKYVHCLIPYERDERLGSHLESIN